jgi:transcriptional regulator with XRE-family HTH domain
MPGKLGEKLRRAREGLALTQEELAKAVGLSSEFISLLEIGKRTPSLDSLRRLSAFLKKDIGYFLQEQESDFQILKKEKRLTAEARGVIRRFQGYCEDYLKLEEVTARRVEPAPYCHTVSAERLAWEERQRLGLGDEPIRNIFLLLEANGLKLFRLAVPEKAQMTGLFVYFDAEQTAFALLNSAQPLGDQYITAAHLYAHFLKDRHAGPILDNPDIFIDEYLPLYHPREKFAQRFARDFLVPPGKLEKLIQKELHGRGLHFEDVIYLKRYFGVKTRTLLGILKNRELIPPHRYHEFHETDHLAFELSLFGEISAEERPSKKRPSVRASDRYKILGVSAYKKADAEKF